MEVANGWSDYEILDMANGEKLERWGNVILIILQFFHSLEVWGLVPGWYKC